MNILILCDYDNYDSIPAVIQYLNIYYDFKHIYLPYNYLIKMANIKENNKIVYFNKDAYNKELDDNILSHTENILSFPKPYKSDFVLLINKENNIINDITRKQVLIALEKGYQVFTTADMLIQLIEMVKWNKKIKTRS